MTISFSPGQAGQVTGTQGPVVPTTPVVPVIAPNGPAVPVVTQSPFAFNRRSKSKFGLYFQLAVFAIFGITVLTTIWLFAYQAILSSELDTKIQTLTDKQLAFKKLPLEDMRKLSDRIAAVNQAMKEHVSVRVAFAILEYGIENSVTYTKFDLTYNEQKKSYSLALSAVAPNYHAVIQQADILRNKVHSQYLSSLFLDKISLDEKEGNVGFNINAIITLPVKPEETFEVEQVTTKASSTSKIASTTAVLIGGAVESNATTSVIISSTSSPLKTASTTNVSKNIGLNNPVAVIPQ